MKIRLGCIYRILNIINYKCYIGQTVNKEKRFKQHLSGRTVPKLANAIKRYGKESFRCEVLYDKIPTWMLSDLEERTIRTYNSDGEDGYNISPKDGTFLYGLDNSRFRSDVYEYRDDIIQMYKDGNSLRIISNKYGCTNETIKLILSWFEVKLRTRSESVKIKPTARNDVVKHSKDIFNYTKMVILFDFLVENISVIHL